jgi:membrane associated rhomboid family serine protease
LSDYRFRSGGYRGTGGGRTYSGGGYGGGGFSLTFPPFSGAVKRLVLINVAVFFGLLLLSIFSAPLAATITTFGALIPRWVLHGAIWQLVTYSFFHQGIWHIAGNMLQLWMFGSTLESGWGSKKFYEFFFFTVIGGALLTVGIAYSHVFGVTTTTPTVGASGGVLGILIAFGLIYGDQPIMFFPFPFSMKAKYFIAILVLINLAGLLGAIQQRGDLVAYGAHLGGALFGFIYVKYVPRQGFGFSASESYYSVRNNYYKWKRRRAAKKFEVYMRKHDRNEYFDQYGNYKAPDDKEKGNGESGRGGWVN